MRGVEWTDAEREAADPWEVFVDTDGCNSIRGKSADDILAALAPHVAAREAQAAAKALREAADSFVERLGPIGHPWAADLRADADRIERGES